MDLRAVRHDLGVVAQNIGLNAWDYQPDDPQNLPAAVVGGIQEMHRLNRIVTQFKLGVTLYVNCADPQDATAALDLYLSTGLDGSFIEALDAVIPGLDSPAWRSVRFDSAGPYRRYSMPGGGAALGVEVVLELTA